MLALTATSATTELNLSATILKERKGDEVVGELGLGGGGGGGGEGGEGGAEGLRDRREHWYVASGKTGTVISRQRGRR